MKETFYELLPLILRDESNEADCNLNFNLHAGFAMQIAHTGICMASIDGDLSDNETGIIRDVWYELSGGVLNPQFPVTELAEIYKRAYEDPKVRASLDEVPFGLQLILSHDFRHGTNFATKAKAMLFHFANAMANADGTASPEKINALSKYKELLDSAKADYLPDEVGLNQKTVGKAAKFSLVLSVNTIKKGARIM